MIGFQPTITYNPFPTQLMAALNYMDLKVKWGSKRDPSDYGLTPRSKVDYIFLGVATYFNLDKIRKFQRIDSFFLFN